VDFIKPNEPETQTITLEKDPILALRHLAQMTRSGVPIVTLAERGSVLLDRDRLYKVPAFRTKAIDPTGAGDVYAGAFLVEYARTSDIVESALFASAAASVMVEQVGPNFVLPLPVVEERKKAIRQTLESESLD
jgi:ribokinase